MKRNKIIYEIVSDLTSLERSVQLTMHNHRLRLNVFVPASFSVRHNHNLARYVEFLEQLVNPERISMAFVDQKSEEKKIFSLKKKKL